MFITFEGGEGCGKSTQARALYKRILSAGIPVVLTREPGGTPLGSRVRHLLKRVPGVSISSATELLLINASRAQLMNDVISPSLAAGTTVVCDRYADSTLAYQGFGRKMGLDVVEQVNCLATGGLLPDLVVLMDVPVEVGLARKRGRLWDRFEAEDVAFHQRVREGYLRLASADPERWLVIDATLGRKTIRTRIWQRVEGLLRQDHSGHL